MIAVLPSEGSEFIDFTGKVRRDGKSPWSNPAFKEGKIVNYYDNKKLVGSLVYEIYSDSMKPKFKENRWTGPLFHRKGKDIILMHTVYVRSKYRGKGIMSKLLSLMMEEGLPVWASFYNKELGQYFEKRFAP